jgi:hypothetical protein
LEGCRSKREATRILGELDLTRLQQLIVSSTDQYFDLPDHLPFGEETSAATIGGALFNVSILAYILLRTLAQFDESVEKIVKAGVESTGKISPIIIFCSFLSSIAHSARLDTLID